jgi:predicted transcriptional regulator
MPKIVLVNLIILFLFPTETVVFHVIRSAPSSKTKLGRHRSAEEITLAILGIADTDAGATKMQIMAGAFITHETATGHLEKLKREGLMDYNQGKGTYVTTIKGKQMITDIENDNPNFSRQDEN